MPPSRLVPINTALIDIQAIIPAAHAISDTCSVHWDDTTSFVARLQPRHDAVDMDMVANRFADALIDHTMRLRLQRETEPIRRLIVAQAFAAVDLLHPGDAAVSVDGPLPAIANPDRPHQRPA